MSLKELAEKTGDAIAIHYVSLADLEDTFLDGNSKKHDTDKIIESIRRYGFRDPIAFDISLNNGNGGIVEGNGRLESLIEMKSQGMNLPRGLKEGWKVPVIFGVNATSEAEAVAFSVEHNWSVMWGSDLELEQITSMFDDTALKQQLEWLDAENSLPISIGNDLDKLLESLEEEAEKVGREVIEDEPPEDVETRVRQGDIWQLGRHRVYCGDSTDEEKIREFLDSNTPDFIWADPPYGINIVKIKKGLGSTNAAKPFGSKEKRGSVGAGNACATGIYPEIIGDDTIDTALNSYQLCKAIASDAPMIIWGGNYYAHKLPPSPCWIIWDKRDGMTSNNFADAEIAWTNQDSPTRVFAHLWNGMIKASEQGEKRVHATQKPITLAEWCFEKYGKEDDFIFDPFLGSGISIIAAEKMESDRTKSVSQAGRTCYGVELSEKYCDVILQRWENLTGEKAKFLKNIG